MRPDYLVISGWGPYKDRVEIDFGKFHGQGLFLITGATGAGKTTIFDAITYALYGALSGQMREKGSVRSDFAAADVETFVELTMTHGGEKYHIYRNPEYLRPKKRKTGKEEFTKEKENATLTLPDGKVLAGTKEVNAKIQEILVLDYQQFKQISMIAQGEFSRMLTASPKEKMGIFREIFGTGIYDKFTHNLRSKAAELYVQAEEQKHKLEEDIRLLLGNGETEELKVLTETDNWNYDAIRTCLKQWKDRLAKESGESQSLYEKLEEQTHALTKLLTEQQEMNRKLQQWANVCRELDDLTGQKEAFAEKEQQLKRARDAAFVEVAETKMLNLKEQEQKGRQQIAEMTEETARFKEEKESLQVFMTCGAEIEEFLTLEEGLKQAKQQEKEYSDKIADRQAALSQEQGVYLQIEADRDVIRNRYEEADKVYKHAAIGIAAQMLQPGEPCPVCGSREHPAPAKQAEGVLSEEALRKLKEDLTKKDQALLQQHGIVTAIQTELAGAEEREKQLRLQIAGDTETCTLRREELEQKGIITAELDRNKLREQTQRLERVAGLLQSKEQEKQKLETELKSIKGQIAKSTETFEKALAEYGFAGEQEYRLAAVSQRDLAAWEQEISNYKETLSGTVNLKTHLEQEVKDEQVADAQATERQLSEAKQSKERVRKEQEKQNSLTDTLNKTIISIKEKQDKLEKIGKEYGYVKDLENLASGNNSKKLVFEQYVLAGYFEEILRAANLRFRGMTGGRYEMSRMEEVGDGRIKDNLEIQVMDYYTGKLRSVRTLSGGESFKASLSLALGLSDVIQAMSGGIRVDVLFVDEGFGALDSESLDQACETLQGLTEQNRMIGIISHVQELRERLDHQIIVEKTSAGSSVKVVV